MTFEATHWRPRLILRETPGPLKGADVVAHVDITDGLFGFAIAASDADEAQLVAGRVVELLNEHGLVAVPDTAEELSQ